MREESMRPYPKITVIALCYNHERFLKASLESIRAQTYTDYELIVVDDYSSDNSPAIIVEWIEANCPAARLILHKKNVGICKSLNEALAMAQGEYLSILAADDLWEATKLEKHVAALDSLGPAYAVVYSDALQIDEDGRLLPLKFMLRHRRDGSVPQGDVFLCLADRNFIPSMAATIRREAILAVGGYDERLCYEDWDIWLRLAAKWRFAFIPDTLAQYRVVQTSLARKLIQSSIQRSLTHTLIGEKCLASGRLTPALTAQWKARMLEDSYELLTLGYPQAAAHLMAAFRLKPGFRIGLVATLATLGVSGSQMLRIRSFLFRSRDQQAVSRPKSSLRSGWLR